MNTSSIKPQVYTHFHEGYGYAEYNGEFYKGCRRCGGTGQYMFDGFDSTCYLCQNIMEHRLGDKFSSEEEAQKWCHGKALARARRQAKKEEERLAKLAKRQAEWDRLALSHPDVWDLVSKTVGVGAYEGTDHYYKERSGFVRSLSEQLWDLDERFYTDRQLEALQKVADSRKEQAQEPVVPAPEGRVVVTGEIVSTKVSEGQYGMSYKLLVKDDRGFRVYVSIPKAQDTEAYAEFCDWVTEQGHDLYSFSQECWFTGTDDGTYPGVKGKRITLTATLQQSNDDPGFAFGSRPTKGQWIKE